MTARERGRGRGGRAIRAALGGCLALTSLSVLEPVAPSPAGAAVVPPARVPPAPCPAFGGLRAASGAARVVRRPVALRNVQVQASRCVDEVAFLFRGGLPGWSVRYRSSGLVVGPSGQPLQVGGAAHLVVRLESADRSGVGTNPPVPEPPVPAYDGPTLLHPSPPSGVVELRQLDGTDAGTTWVIGLTGLRRFDVVRRADQLVVRLNAPAGRQARCRPPGTHLTQGYPASWYAELSDRWACQYFNPRPFVVLPATDAFTWAVTVGRASGRAGSVLAGARSAATTLHYSSTRVAGLPAVALDLETSGLALYPKGWRYRLYVVDAGARAVTVQSTPAPPGPKATANEAAASRLASLLRHS